MTLLDWLIVLLYFLLSLGIGIVYSKRAGKSIQEFFLSGRSLPWWLAGTSMVATTFAADTPLAITEFVAKNGIAGNWFWWSYVFGGTLTVFFFARLWRRAGVMTDVEFIELRYSGKPAAFLRGFRAVYLGLFMNSVIMGWVNLAMASILEGIFGIPKPQVFLYVGGCLILVALYSALSGLWGVAVTDAFQFVLAMVGTIVLAVIVVNLPQIGGMGGLKSKLPEWALQFLPAVGSAAKAAPEVGATLALTLPAFFAYVGVQWWASWYPGAEPGGGGYVAQRMMSAKDERHSILATLWFTVAHYCLRPWPWILVGLASLILYPTLGPDDKKLGYVYVMRDYLPAGLMGLLIAAFFAAYMSTIATQLNWGTSYLINDFYRRFLRRQGTEKHYVLVSRFATIFVMIVSLLLTLVITTITDAWKFIVEAGAGLGLVLILRWYWWRINAWSEMSAMVAPFIAFGYLKLFHSATVQFPQSLFYIVAFTTIVWLATTFLTKPTDEQTLIEFYRRVHPGGFLWKRIAAQVPEVAGGAQFFSLFLDWVAGIVLVYTALFGIGKLIFGEYLAASFFFAAACLAGMFISWDLRRLARRPL